jgi:ActR/RegA family two-component response regulator
MGGDVLLLDDDNDLLDSVAELIEISAERRVWKARSLAEVIALEDQALGCELAIVDINLGPNVPSGLEVLRWLTKRRFAGQFVLLTGHAPGFPLVDQALKLADVKVLSKPLSCDKLLSLLEHLT